MMVFKWALAVVDSLGETAVEILCPVLVPMLLEGIRMGRSSEDLCT